MGGATQPHATVIQTNDIMTCFARLLKKKTEINMDQTAL